MASSEYDDRVEALLSYWKDDIQGGLLKGDITPAIKIYAHASLQAMTDEYDVPTTFPMLPSDWDIYDHYDYGLFARLRSACTSILTALQAIQAHMDSHAAIASARRAHESLWQLFWLCNPTKNANERVKRLLIITKQEIEEALNSYSQGVNPQVGDKLGGYKTNIEKIIGTKSRYSAKRGREEYRQYYRGKFNDPLPEGLPPAPENVDVERIVWSMMSNLTHPNVVFDWINQIQENPEDHMAGLQALHLVGAMSVTTNLCTLLMQQAKIAEDKTLAVNERFKRCVLFAQSLLDIQRS